MQVAYLTHLNFAFAYIDPNTYDIVTMDPQTPVGLFREVAIAKVINPNLKVFLSIGGWTFFDPGAATRPVLSQIARFPGARQIFADNVVAFMRTYGYDGMFSSPIVPPSSPLTDA